MRNARSSLAENPQGHLGRWSNPVEVYPRRMAGRPGERPGQDERTGEEKPSGDVERTGPIAIARHVKDDGRALILYSRDAQTHS